MAGRGSTTQSGWMAAIRAEGRAKTVRFANTP
jgi:hypothetical protein